MKKKTVVVGMAVMLLSLIADSAVLFAATSGKCGDKITWTLDDAGNLELTGSGEMFDYNYQNGVETPWGTAIKSLSMNGAITNIGAYAFAGCRGLTSVKIPKSVGRVGESAFEFCISLKEVNITDLAAWCKIDFVTYDANPLCYGSYLNLDGMEVKSLVIPKSVESISAYAFYGCRGVTGVKIPSPVTGIGEFAFYDCSGLTNVEIGDSVKSIGAYAFYGCKDLTNIEMGNSVKSIGEGAFWCCSGLTSVEIPNSVTSIGKSAFNYCGSLASVKIPDNVTCIKEQTFYNCRRLTRMEIGKSVDSIGDYAFLGCSSLTSVDIPSSVKCIGVSAFQDCNLTCVEIPSSVTSIGEFAFSGCGNLRSVRITDLAAWCKINFVNYYANPLCYGSNLYLNGEELTELTIPSSVEVVGAYAFAGCGGLTNVEIGNSVKRIEVSAFRNCRGLKSVKIPNSVGGRVFVRCKNLANVDIPSSVNGIRDYAFYGCTGLTKIEVLAKVPPICGMKVFYGLDKNKCELMVPIESIEAYKTAGTWKDFMKITAGVGGVDSDDASMTVTVHDGEIIISGKTVNDAVVEVYDMHGIFVYRGKSRSIVVPRDGIYAVRIGSRVEKVAVK